MKKTQRQPLQMKNKRKTPIDTEHKNENFRRSKHNVLFLYLIADPFSFVFCQRDRGLCGVTRSFMGTAACDVFARHKPRYPRVSGTPWSPRAREGNENTLLPEPTHEHTYLTPDQITSRSFSKAHCLFDNLFHWTFIFGIRRPTFAKTMETLMFDMLSDCFLLPKNKKNCGWRPRRSSWTYWKINS